MCFFHYSPRSSKAPIPQARFFSPSVMSCVELQTQKELSLIMWNTQTHPCSLALTDKRDVEAERKMVDLADESCVGKKKGNEGMNSSWWETLRSVMCFHVVINGTQGWRERLETPGLVLQESGSRPHQRSLVPHHRGSFDTRGSLSSPQSTHLPTHSTTQRVEGHYHPWALCGTLRVPSPCTGAWLKPSAQGFADSVVPSGLICCFNRRKKEKSEIRRSMCCCNLHTLMCVNC